jgi:hypothetical protein
MNSRWGFQMNSRWDSWDARFCAFLSVWLSATQSGTS